MPKLYSVRFEIGETLSEYKVALAALSRFQAGVQRAQPGFSLPRGTQPRHVDQAFEELEGTYLIRMWAVFEAAWVSFWRYRTGHAGTIKAMHLIQWAEGVQEGHKAADNVTDDVNRVRLYRTSWSTATTRRLECRSRTPRGASTGTWSSSPTSGSEWTTTTDRALPQGAFPRKRAFLLKTGEWRTSDMSGFV